MQSFRKIVWKFFEIIKFFEFSGSIYPYNCKRLGEGPYPLLDCQNSLKKRRPPRGRVARVMDRARLPVWP